MISKQYTSHSRDARVLIEKKLTKEGYKESYIFQNMPIREEIYNCWDRIEIYEGKLPKNGSIIIRYLDDTYFNHSKDGYVKTNIGTLFININKKDFFRLEKIIESAINEAERNTK